MSYDPRILAALDITADVASAPGNVAAHAYNLANGGGFAGMNLGWKDQQESTDFLVSIVDAVEECLIEGNLDDVSSFEIADQAVPVYNHALLACAIQLDATSVEEVELPDNPTMYDIARYALFEVARDVASALISALGELPDPDDYREIHDNGVVEILDEGPYLESTYPGEDDNLPVATCGTCGRSWDDRVITALTPAPSGRCPFEYDHDTEEN